MLTACIEKSCPLPVLRLNRCVNHLREYESQFSIGANPAFGKKPPQLKPIGEPPKLMESTRREIAEHQKYGVDSPPKWKYLARDEIKVHRQRTPKWIWLYDALQAMPEGKCALEIECPKDILLERFRNMVSTGVRQKFNKDRWSCRKSTDRQHIVITKEGSWREHLDAKFETAKKT